MSQEPSTARRLLFDRLLDLERSQKREDYPQSVLSQDGLRLSIRSEIENLLNTRISVPIDELAGLERTVIDYGIPDFTMLSPQRPEDRLQISDVIRRSIEAFEPRLENVEVSVELEGIANDSLTVQLQANCPFDTIAEPVSFNVSLRWSGGDTEVRGVE